jgi:twitching motility protein PilU
MEQGVNEGCATFDQALFDLYCDGRVDETEALRAADSPNNLRLRIERFRRQGQFIGEPELRLVKLDQPPRVLTAVRR